MFVIFQISHTSSGSGMVLADSDGGGTISVVGDVVTIDDDEEV
jgi:hypothetical protein